MAVNKLINKFTLITMSTPIIQVFATLPTNRSIRVMICFVVDFMRSVANVFGPVFSPIDVFISHLIRCSSVSADNNAINHAPNQGDEPKD